MNIFKWLKDKAGKMPVTLAQAAGLTAVVGAAGFAAMNFLSGPADTNNTFIPPSANGGEVVYVSQNGGGYYEANGEIGSAFKAAPSRSIQLANQQQLRADQERALEESSAVSYTPDGDVPLPKAYQMAGGELGMGMGTGKDQQAGSSLDAFTGIQKQLDGLTAAVTNAQAQASSGSGKAAEQAAGAPAGKNAAQLASAPRNWGQGGLTRAGGGSGSSNTFAIQDSGKNAKGGNADAQQAMAQAGDVMAQAQAALANMQKEGTRMQARANFGTDRLGKDKDAFGQRARRYGSARSELEFVRKKTAAIASNKTNAANEGATPFLASNKISGGLIVDGELLTTGQGSSSKDLSTNYDRAFSGLRAKGAQLQAQDDERKLAKKNLQNYFWTVFPAAMLGIFAISVLVKAAKVTLIPWVRTALYIAAAILTAAIVLLIWRGLASKIHEYIEVCGADGWSTFGYAFSGVLTAGTAAAWIFGPSLISNNVLQSVKLIGPLLGFGAVGYSTVNMLTNKDQYLKEVEEANSQTTDIAQRDEADFADPNYRNSSTPTNGANNSGGAK